MSISTPRSHQLTTWPFTSHQAATAALHMMISPLRNTIRSVHPIAWYPYPYPYLCSYLCPCPCRCPCLCVWVYLYVLMSIVPYVCFCFCAVCPATCDKCHETCHHATCNAMYGTWYMANVIWNGEHVCLSVAKGELVHLCTCACFLEDSEDVAHTSFMSFARTSTQNRFTHHLHRHLWPLLERARHTLYNTPVGS